VTSPDLEGARPKLRLDLQRRSEHAGGLLSGTAYLTVPVAQSLGRLQLALITTRTRAGLLGRLRRETLDRRELRLLGPQRERRWPRRPLGLYAPGTYALGFRLPLGGVPVTQLEPGATQHVETRLALVLERAHDRLRLSLPVSVRPPSPAEVAAPAHSR
jgi:hypothetical protein